MTNPIIVLCGGWSAERPVSLNSGADVYAACQTLGYETTLLDVTSAQDLINYAFDPERDLVFNTLHGPWGEDGHVQAFLNLLGVRYTHSGQLASSLAMDKHRTKLLCATAGITSAKGVVVEGLPDQPPLEPPFVMKPVCEGSSIGIYLVHNEADWQKIQQTWEHGTRPYLIEQYIPGRELTVPVLNGEPLPVIEIHAEKTVFYDYAAKYQDDVHARYSMPADLPDDVTQAAQRLAVLTYETIGCAGLARVDFRYDEANPVQALDKKMVLLEVNTQPGMLRTSLAPSSASVAGIAYEQLVDRLIKAALAKPNV